MTTRVDRYYIEIEEENLDSGKNKLFFQCRCGAKSLKIAAKKENFGRQVFCTKCKKLLATISMVVTWRRYLSGKKTKEEWEKESCWYCSREWEGMEVEE